MKLLKVLVASTLLVAAANANDVMQKSMASMEQGMALIQKGFLNKMLN